MSSGTLLRIFGLLFLLFVTGCHRAPESPPEFVFAPWGLEVRNLRPGTPVKLYNASGRLVLSYPPLWGETEVLVFRWSPGARYILELGEKSYSVTAPQSRIKASLRLFAPLGQSPYEAYLYEDGEVVWTAPPGFAGRDFVLAGEERCFELGLLVTSHVKGPLTLSFPSGEVVLNGPFERHLEISRLCFPDPAHPVVFKVGIDRKELAFPLRWEKTDLSRAVSLLSWRLPTDAYGFLERHRLEGTLIAPNPFWEGLARWLGIKAKGFSRFDPLAYETLVLKNHLSAPLTLLVRADFLDPKTRAPVPGFYPKRFSGHGEMKKPLALVDLPPQGQAKAVLPIFLDETVAPGEYLARVEIFPFGSTKPILVREKRIGVVRGNVALSAALLLVLVLGLGYSAGLLLGLKRLVARFRLRDLTLIALTGAVGFGLDFLGGVASNILHAFLGPFNVLVGGLVTEVAHYLVLTAVLYLLSRPGVVTLSGLITYLMGGFLFGGFRITDPFFVGARLFVLEFFLFVFRAYARDRAGAARLVLALSLADAVNTAISLLLHMTFYRLFFPGWFILLSVGVKGFLYTLIGAILGVRVGRLLLRVER